LLVRILGPIRAGTTPKAGKLPEICQRNGNDSEAQGNDADRTAIRLPRHRILRRKPCSAGGGTSISRHCAWRCHMTGSHLKSVAIAALILATTTTRSLAADNSLPVYPGATNRMQGVPAGAGLAQYETADPADKVDAWYGAHLPKTCKHETARGGAKYACSGTSIMITPDRGKTVITHMASWIGGR
jgi:hypothetical protein